MIKTAKVKNTSVNIIGYRHSDWDRSIGIELDRREDIPGAVRPIPTAYTFTINLWKYIAIIKVMKEKNK